MEENAHIHIATFEEGVNPELPAEPRNKKDIEHMPPKNKQLILEIDNSALIDCSVQWMMMPNNDLQEKIVQRISTVTKKEDVDDPDVDDQDDQEISNEPVVPPAKMVSIKTQTDFPEQPEQPGSSHQREEPASSVGSQQREETEEKKKNISADDSAPQVKPVTLEYYGEDISGNETDFILRKLGDCFEDGYHGEWAGFCNLGFPALSQSRHMMWYKQYRQTVKPHHDYWYQDTERTS